MMEHLTLKQATMISVIQDVLSRDIGLEAMCNRSLFW